MRRAASDNSFERNVLRLHTSFKGPLKMPWRHRQNVRSARFAGSIYTFPGSLFTGVFIAQESCISLHNCRQLRDKNRYKISIDWVAQKNDFDSVQWMDKRHSDAHVRTDRHGLQSHQSIGELLAHSSLFRGTNEVYENYSRANFLRHRTSAFH